MDSLIKEIERLAVEKFIQTAEVDYLNDEIKRKDLSFNSLLKKYLGQNKVKKHQIVDENVDNEFTRMWLCL